jgi:hypothetical protein
MAKPKTPNQKRKYSELNSRLAKYVALIEEIYEQLNLEAAKLVSNSTDYDADSEKPFRWADYPKTRNKIADIQRQFVEDIQAVIYRGTSEEWKNSNEVQDLLANAVLRSYDAQVNGEQYRIYYQDNSDGLKAFQERKDKGLNISEKLWQQSAIYKQGLEDAISCAIQKGTSAVVLSEQISKYLRDFPQLQKDYKERFGKASRAKDCEYRSIRLARSEINMAYRQAENQRWQQMDFVVGYEIKLSGSHHVDDICDQLKGKYPKTFIWTGWHPNDMCYKIPILKTEEEFWAWDGRSDVTTESINEVKDVPDGFKRWIDNNIHRAKSWESTPYFICDNKDFIREDFKVNVYNKTEKVFVRKRRTNLSISRVEYYNKTYPNIPEVQQAAVNAYTQAIGSDNKGATSQEINRRLRNGTEDEYVKVASRLISQALKKLPAYEGMVYRGETMSMKKLQERFLNHIGEVVSDKGFVSSSLYMDTPMKFISHDGIPKSHKRVIFEIQSKKGRNISKISEFNGIFNPENRHEILFDKGTKFIVLDKDFKDGIYITKLVEQ